MNRAQRIVLVAYCLMLAYCCLWIPWHVQRNSRFSNTYIRSGYGWLWTGPEAYCHPPGEHSASLCNIVDPPGRVQYDLTATPDLELLGLRLVAATAIASAAFILASLLAKAVTLS